MTTEYTVYDVRTGRLCGRSMQPDTSQRSEQAAADECHVPRVWADHETRELSDDAAREYVG